MGWDDRNKSSCSPLCTNQPVDLTDEEIGEQLQLLADDELDAYARMGTRWSDD